MTTSPRATAMMQGWVMIFFTTSLPLTVVNMESP